MPPARDLILLETVGTGQSEIDVAEVADIRIVVSAPGPRRRHPGDEIRACSRSPTSSSSTRATGRAPSARCSSSSARCSLRAGMSRVPVLKTTATTGDGVPELVAAIAEAGRKAEAEGPVARRRRRARYLIARAAADLIAAHIRAGGKQALDSLADQVLTGDLAPEDAAATLLKA